MNLTGAPWGWPSRGGAVLYRLSPQLGEDPPPVEDPGLCEKLKKLNNMSAKCPNLTIKVKIGKKNPQKTILQKFVSLAKLNERRFVLMLFKE